MSNVKNYRLVYLVRTVGGGVDGRDPSDKPCVTFASFDPDVAEGRCNAWSKTHVESLDIIETRKRAMDKLSPVERLVLGLTGESLPEPVRAPNPVRLTNC
jgi:hypothetical protein